MAGRAYRLKSKEKPRRGIRRIAAGRAEHALEQLAKGGEKTVHEARKDLKKMRSLLRLVRADLGKRTYRAENRRYRDAGRRLSAARDAEVKLETLSALQERFAAQIDDEMIKAFREVLEREHSAQANAVGSDGGLSEESATAIAAGKWRIADWRLRAKGWGLVGPGVRRTYRRGRNEMKRVADGGNAADVHEWRKRTKDLWYQLRILRDAWPAVLAPTADEVHELSDLLGDHHDLQVLGDDVRERAGLFIGKDEAKQLAKLAQRRQKELLGQALEIGERVYAEKPKRFEKRLRRYWRAWRR
jgi:CHAD domain-containing protein